MCLVPYERCVVHVKFGVSSYTAFKAGWTTRGLRWNIYRENKKLKHTHTLRDALYTTSKCSFYFLICHDVLLASMRV